MLKKKLIIIYSIFIAVILIGFLIWWLLIKDNTATLEILVAPSSSKILINNKKYTNGTYKLKPGKYSVEISKDNFESYSGSILLNQNETTKLYQALKQKDGSSSWYIKNNKDDIIQTAIGDQKTKTVQENLTTKYPILKYIPYSNSVNNIFIYKIDTQFDSNNNLEYINILLNTCSTSSINQYKTNALDWIKSKGINPSDYVIKYSTPCSNSI